MHICKKNIYWYNWFKIGLANLVLCVFFFVLNSKLKQHVCMLVVIYKA